MQDQIIQIVTCPISMGDGVVNLSLHGLSKAGVLYQLVTSEESGQVWEKILESPITNK